MSLFRFFKIFTKKSIFSWNQPNYTKLDHLFFVLVANCMICLCFQSVFTILPFSTENISTWAEPVCACLAVLQGFAAVSCFSVPSHRTLLSFIALISSLFGLTSLPFLSILRIVPQITVNDILWRICRNF